MAAERRWIFLVTVLVFLIGSTIYALRQPLEFETSALVRVKAPPLPKEFSIEFHGGVDFWRSPDLAVQVAKGLKISEEPGDTWPAVSWLSQSLEISETEGLITLTLRGGFAQRTVRDALAAYIEEAAKKLQAQRESIAKELQEFLKSRLAQMRVGEQGATLESWYYRTYLESLLGRLGEVERELDLFGAQGIRVFEEYQRVRELDERMSAFAQAQVEARQIAESWEPVELVTPAQLPQGPVGPDRAQTILWGVGIGVVVGFLLAVFSPRQREPNKP